MPQNSVFVTAHIKTKEGLEEKVGEVLAALIDPTRSEPGCIFYDLYRDPEDQALFMFFEGWKSEGDLDAHLQKPYIRAFIEKSGELLAEPLKVSAWEKVSGE